VNILEKNSYKIDNDVLTIRSICGEYSFKMEESGTTDNIHRIAQMMVSEMIKAESAFINAGTAINPHVLVLLANLNLSKKYVELKDRLDTLNQTLEEKTQFLSRAKPRCASTQTSFPQPSPRSEEVSGIEDVQPIKDVKPEAIKSPLESDIIDDLQQINSLLSDPVADVPHDPLPNPGPVSSDLSPSVQTKDITQPTEVEKKPESVSAPMPAPEPASTPEIPSAPKEEKTAPEPHPAAINIETTDISLEQTNAHRPAQVPHLPSGCPGIPLVQKTAETTTEAEPSTDTINVQTPQPAAVSEAEIKETVEPETAAPTPEPKPAEAETSQPAAAPEVEIKETAEPETTAPTPETPQTTASAGTAPPKEETPCNENQTSMGSFPIHIATAYPQVNTHSPDLKNDSTATTFELPSLKFLKNINSKTEVDHESIRRDAELLEKKLGYFGIKGEVMGVSPGPVITTFEYKPDPGIKISKIVNLADDLALALSAYSIRIVAPIPGKDVMGIEIPNLKKSIVPFIDIVSSEDFINSTSKLPICLGKDIIGNPVVVELESMPHLLIAGATGTGKSVGLNAMITSILYKANPDEVKFLMIDPKRIELSLYNDIPHLITPVITDMKKATTALQWMVREMERRYDLLAKYQVRNIEQFNQKMKKMNGNPEISHEELPDPLSYIVIIIDELADLMMTASRDVELSLTRLAQMARAAGIHLILATQRPSVDVLTGIIKANFPTRISFQVSSKTDSRTIIDSNGAETLLGMGDMLFVPPGTARLTRVHGTYLSEEELIDVTSFLKAQQSPEYLFDVITEQQEEPEQDYRDDEYDEKYHEALEVVMATRQASISGIQRALRVGYNRAARIIDIMEKKGIVGPSDGAKPRQVLSGPMD